MIGELAFADYNQLRNVIFNHVSVVEKIQFKTFWGSELKIFAALPLLTGHVAFGKCTRLKTFPQKGVQELD